MRFFFANKFLNMSTCNQFELLISPDQLRIFPSPNDESKVIGKEFTGSSWLYQIESANIKLQISMPLEKEYSYGTSCKIRLIKDSEVILFPQCIRVKANCL